MNPKVNKNVNQEIRKVNEFNKTLFKEFIEKNFDTINLENMINDFENALMQFKEAKIQNFFQVK